MGVAAKIGEIAKERGVALKELSRRVDVPYTTLYNAVKRDSKIDLETVNRIAKALNTDIGSFYSELELQIAGIPGHTELWDEFEQQERKNEEENLLRDYRKLNCLGRTEAQRRLHEMTLIPDYQKDKDPSNK